MTKIILEVKDCSDCPHRATTPYPTEDSWERAENWWCTHDSVLGEPNEEGMKGKKIAGYVEWHDKTPIPDWCPIKAPDNMIGHAVVSKTVPGGTTVVPTPSPEFIATEDNDHLKEGESMDDWLNDNEEDICP